jgi:Arc/MetJ family transcription regulator
MAAVEPIRDWHQIAVEMMMTDADLALQTVAALFAEDDKEAVARIVRNTRSVYDSILERRREVGLSYREANLLDDKMDRLRARLRFMGEAV